MRKGEGAADWVAGYLTAKLQDAPLLITDIATSENGTKITATLASGMKVFFKVEEDPHLYVHEVKQEAAA